MDSFLVYIWLSSVFTSLPFYNFSAHAHIVVVCEHANFKGRCLNLDMTEVCLNLPHGFRRSLSSIDTRNASVLLWEKEGCHGRKIKVSPGTHSHYNLETVGFNDLTTALQITPRQEPKESVKFFLYDDPGDKNNSKEIQWGDGSSIRQIRLEGYPRVKMYIHGFQSSSKTENAQLVKNEYLSHYGEGLPVIMVDWAQMANESIFHYSTVSEENVPKVASHVSKFISDMQMYEVIASVDNVHLVGHSLGGQMSGLIGHEIFERHGPAKIGRISSLDPAGPNYWDKPPEQRVDKSDAKFVDVLHTTATLGFYWTLGHADFFANVGRLIQIGPGGCSTPSCRHNQAVKFFAYSIKDTSILGCSIRWLVFPGGCSSDCREDVVFGEHISETVEGEFCFMGNAGTTFYNIAKK